MTDSSSERADLDYVASLFPEVHEIGDEQLRQKVLEIWVDVWRESGWARIEDAPKNPNVPGPGLVEHVRSVTRQAVATAEIMQELHGIPFHRDHMLAGGLLHDVSKLVEVGSTPDGFIKTDTGRLIQHGVYAAFKAWQKGLPQEIVHILITHTHRSGMKPATWEGVVVHYVDYLDSDALLFAAGKDLLLKR